MRHYGADKFVVGVRTTDEAQLSVYLREPAPRFVSTPFGILCVTGAMYLQCGICGLVMAGVNVADSCKCDMEAPSEIGEKQLDSATAISPAKVHKASRRRPGGRGVEPDRIDTRTV